MKNMKKLLVVVLSLVMVFGLVGCGGGKEAKEEYTADNPLVLKVAYVLATEDIGHQAFEKFKENIEEESEGRIKVELYPNAELGSDTAVLESVMLGDVQIANVALGALTAYDPKVTIAELPYLFDTYEDMDEAINGPVGDEMAKWCEDVGFLYLGSLYDGTREISNNVRPIYTLDDVKGLKLRAMDSPSHIALLESLGASAIPMPYGDIYTGLQQGTIDGQDNAPSLTYSSKFHEVQKYYSLIDAVRANAPVVMNKEVFDSYPEDIQKLIRDNIQEWAIDWQRPEQRSQELEILDKINAEGCAVNKVDNIDEFKEATKAVWDKAREDYGDEFVDNFLEIAGYNK